MKLTLIVQC